jgi:hypothetical protein
MGSDALLSSGVTEKMLYLIRDRRAISPSDPLNKVRKSRIVLFTAVELVGFGATFAVTQVSDSDVCLRGATLGMLRGRMEAQLRIRE